MSPKTSFRLPSAHQCRGESLAAPAVAGQRGGTILGVRSPRTRSTSGMLAYLITTYPASFSSESRAASFSAFPLWLASSSSMTARTWKALSHTTKSAVFLSNVFRVPYARAVSSALKLTCASTTQFGRDCVRRLCIACSLSVNGDFRFGFSAAPFSADGCFFMAANTAAITTKATTNISNVFIRFPSSLLGSFA